jgi:hypothetical protein
MILVIATGFSGGPACDASVVMTRIMFPLHRTHFHGLIVSWNLERLPTLCDPSVYARSL